MERPKIFPTVKVRVKLWESQEIAYLSRQYTLHLGHEQSSVYIHLANLVKESSFDMEEEKLRAIKRNLMGALEEDFEDNLDDIDESDLDEFLMNTDEQVKTSEVEKKEVEEKEEICDTEEDCDAKNDVSKEEGKETDDTENLEDETKGEKDEEEKEDERIEEELEKKDTNEQSDSSKWTFKGRSITSPQVFLVSIYKFQKIACS